jgi:hypothetical protein
VFEKEARTTVWLAASGGRDEPAGAPSGTQAISSRLAPRRQTRRASGRASSACT